MSSTEATPNKSASVAIEAPFRPSLLGFPNMRIGIRQRRRLNVNRLWKSILHTISGKECDISCLGGGSGGASNRSIRVCKGDDFWATMETDTPNLVTVTVGVLQSVEEMARRDSHFVVLHKLMENGPLIVGEVVNNYNCILSRMDPHTNTVKIHEVPSPSTLTLAFPPTTIDNPISRAVAVLVTSAGLAAAIPKFADNEVVASILIFAGCLILAALLFVVSSLFIGPVGSPTWLPNWRKE